MATIRLPPDFKEFLKLLNSNEVEYLLIGGYAVGFYGYPRATLDMDVWVAITLANAEKLVNVLRGFGFDLPELEPGLFLNQDKVIRMGVPPVRIEVITTIDGVTFEDCYSRRRKVLLDGIPVDLIDLTDLKQNKKASARHKDLDDLEHLPK